MENKKTSAKDGTERSADGEKEATNEEIQISDEIFKDLNENINKFKQIQDLRAEDGNWNHDLVKSLRFFGKVFEDIANSNHLQNDLIDKYLREAGQRLSESPTSIMCKIIIDGWRRGYRNKDGQTDNREYQAMLLSFSNLHKYSDSSPEVTYDITGEPHFLETLKLILTTLFPIHMKGEAKNEDEVVISSCLGIFHNTSMMDQNIPRLRSLEIVPVLDSFLDANDEMYHLSALATLANIIDEQESAILRDKPDVIALLLDTLKMAIQDDKHRNKGWSAKECAMAVRRIARNDANKKILVRLRCLQHLVKLAKDGNVQEQREAVGAILVLAFERDNHSKIIDNEELKIIALLCELKKTSKDEEIRKAADKIFWILREELQKNEKYKNIDQFPGIVVGHLYSMNSFLIKRFHSNPQIFINIVSSFEQKNRPVSAAQQRGKRSGATVKSKKGHIMISYNWDHQTDVKKIKSFLEENDYDVWVDTDNMNGSTLQAMADAVEGAHVVLICMSQKYKDSPNCRLEAEYAHKLNKNIIPLKMERRYEPDGWLGILIGTQLYYEFSGKYPFEAKLKDLIRGIIYCYENENVKPRGAAIKSQLERTAALIREWTPDRVNKWIEEKKLPKDKFQEFTSGELALLVTMRSEAPEFVYNCLQKNLGINSLKTMALFIEGLEDLLSKDLQDLSA